MRLLLERVGFILFAAIIIPAILSAKVGDWKSYGPTITWYDLAADNGALWARTSGGIVRYENGEFEQITNSTGLIDNVKVSAFFVDGDGKKWVGTSVSPAVISYFDDQGNMKNFDLGLTEIQTIFGRSGNMFAAYKQNLTTGIAHFVKVGDDYVFRDFYDQFPEAIDEVYDIEIVDNSLYLGTDVGLWQADLSSPNLKPADSWSRPEGDISGNVRALYNAGDILYYTRDNLLLSYTNGVFTQERSTLSTWSQPFFIESDSTVYFIQGGGLYSKESGSESWIYKYKAPGLITGAAMFNNQICLGINNYGFISLNMDWEIADAFRPNSPFTDTYQSVAVDDEGKVYISGSQGLSILSVDGWTNIVRSDTINALHPVDNEHYSADTLAYTVIGSPQTYDLVITSRNMAYASYNGVHTDLAYISYDPIINPGAVFYVNLENHTEYGMLDTTDDLFDGSEASTGGTKEYVVARGMTEGSDGSMWFINAHASNGEPLIRISVNNNITKYSVDESGGNLQILAREMVFDDRNRLWIANQEHTENQPLTTGGITVYDHYKNEWYLITKDDGLASDDIYSIDKDIDGSMWVVSAGGVQNIAVPTSWTDATFHSVIAQNIRSAINGLGDVSVTKIRVDIQGNKWILTSDGGVRIYQRNGTYYNSGYGYTTENSPLLSDIVFDIDFDDTKGIAYILTSNGLNSVETPWTSEVTTVDNIIIYPQPYHPQSDPWLIIDGIPDQTEMIISTLNGRSLLKIDTEYTGHLGKQIQWDGKLGDGTIIRPGVYYIFIYNIDGLAATRKFAVR